MSRICRNLLWLSLLTALVAAGANAFAQTKVYLNPSDQYENSVSGGGNEAEYALINAEITEDILDGAGFNSQVDQDFYNAPSNANSWGAKIFVSIHSNAGGGHGTETLYKSVGGQTLAASVQQGLLDALPYQDRGLKKRDDLHVLNNTDMYACLTEVVFHDCTALSGYLGHPPSESAYLKSSAGQQAIGGGMAAGVCEYFNTSCSGGTVDPPNQKGWFKGVVFKAPNMQDRLANAMVKLNTGETVMTGETGYFEFQVAPGEYTATASAPGYLTASAVRTVVANQEAWGSIGLTPSGAVVDNDNDGIADNTDNCVGTYNPNQADTDSDGKGDACDTPTGPTDVDSDGLVDSIDNCPTIYNPNQADSDGDGMGNACDDNTAVDTDKDGINDANDNCITTPNVGQNDSDGDGKGDACDPTPYPTDGDVVSDYEVLCPPCKSGEWTQCPVCNSECGAQTGGCSSNVTADSNPAALIVIVVGLAALAALRRRVRS